MTPAPKWFKPVAIVALIWNLLGCAVYLMQVTMSPEKLATLPAEQQAMYNNFPTWGVMGMAFGVWCGALGSLALVMGKKWAAPLLGASLGGVIVQDMALNQMGALESGIVMQGLVLVIAIALFVLGRRAKKEGWIS